MINWEGEETPHIERPKGWGIVRLILRAVPIALVIYGLLIPFWILRLFRLHKAAQYVVQAACLATLKIMSIPLIIKGKPMKNMGAMVANHGSWMDIFCLNAAHRIYFVAKAEVSHWGGIGILARSTGTVFIDRRQRRARDHAAELERRMHNGDLLLFFPEGTSTDARRVLPFRSSLFASFLALKHIRDLSVQPVTVSYIAPEGQPANFYGWWGDMDFAPHLMKILASRKQGRIVVEYHPPLKVSDFDDRKRLSQTCETIIRDSLILEGE